MSSAGTITFQSLHTPFRLQQRTAVRLWLTKCLAERNHTPGELNFVFTTDEEVLRLNQQHLNHDYFTDILTFPMPSGQGISADLVLSIDRIRENAKTLGNNTIDETHRVMAHGILHLIGHNDDTLAAQQKMRAAEDHWLSHQERPRTTN